MAREGGGGRSEAPAAATGSLVGFGACGRRGCGRGGLGFGGGPGRGRGRVFDNGDLRLVVMHLLSERPRHGYEIIKALEERVGGGYSPSPGVVYPTLTLLEELGHASVSDERAGRKLYALTAEGQGALAASRAVVDAIFARLESAAARGGPPPQVVRAMENLAVAVRLRLQAGASATGEAEVRAIAAVLDAAARAVEEV
jgi:DNA-binding PadR family transcriptional regulator